MILKVFHFRGFIGWICRESEIFWRNVGVQYITPVQNIFGLYLNIGAVYKVSNRGGFPVPTIHIKWSLSAQKAPNVCSVAVLHGCRNYFAFKTKNGFSLSYDTMFSRKTVSYDNEKFFKPEILSNMTIERL